MVGNPAVACPLINFINDLKKSGLYVLAHVKVVENHLNLECDPITGEEYADWLSFIDDLKVSVSN